MNIGTIGRKPIGEVRWAPVPGFCSLYFVGSVRLINRMSLVRVS